LIGGKAPGGRVRILKLKNRWVPASDLKRLMVSTVKGKNT